MEKIRDLFKKIGDINGIFHARMGMIKDENTQRNYTKKISMTQITAVVVI